MYFSRMFTWFLRHKEAILVRCISSRAMVSQWRRSVSLIINFDQI